MSARDISLPHLFARRIQRVSYTTSGGGTQSITAVNTANTFLQIQHGRNGAIVTSGTIFHVQLTGSTQLTFTQNTSPGTAAKAIVDVIELYPGIIKSIQRGTATMSHPNNSVDVTINAVNTAKSVVNILGAIEPASGAATTLDQYIFTTPELTSSTNARFSRGGTSDGDVVLSYEVIEFY